MSRRNIGRVVMVVWIAALAWLARRELFQGEASTMTAGAARLSPDAKYFRVDAGTLQIGVMNLTWDTLPTGFTLQELLALDLPAGGTIHRSLQQTMITTSRALTLQSVVHRFTSISGNQQVELTLPADSIQRYAFQTSSGGASNRRSLGPKPTIAGILPMRLAYGNRLDAGEVIEEPVAELSRRATGTIRGTIGKDTLFVLPDSVEYDSVATVWRTITLDTVHARLLDLEVEGMPERWWVDDNGRMVRLETPFGVTLQRAPFDYSHTLYRDSLRDSGPTPRLPLAGVRSLVAAGVRPDTASPEMRFGLSRTDGPVRPEALRWLAGGAQSVDSTVVTISRRWPSDTAEAPEGYLLSPSGSTEFNRLSKLLADTAFAGASSRRDSVVRLTRWLHRRFTIDTNSMHSPDPEAIGRGWTATPEALAATLVTLARAGGIPARMVTGLAVTPQGLFSHSWAEAWVGGSWVPVDPLNGHAPASARLLRIREGGLGGPFETLWRTAALRVETLTTGSR